MSKVNVKKILEHPDKDEVISKLIIGITPKDINDWLKSKYSALSDSKFILSENALKTFQDNYLDIYNMIRQDIMKTKQAVALSEEDQLILSIQKNPTYKSKMMELADKEIDVRKIIANMCVAIEHRVGQVFDIIEKEPEKINSKQEYVLINYVEKLGNMLEKYWKFTEAPVNTTVQHNVTLQVVDQHINVFHDVMRDVLSQMDLETSLYFMDVFKQKMDQLKAPGQEVFINTDMKLAEAKLLSETIDKKLK